MMHRAMATCFLLVSAVDLCAAEPGIVSGTDPSRWQATSFEMAYEDYLSSVEHNRRVVKQQLRLYANRLVREAGGYGRAIGLAGTVAAVAYDDTRLSLGGGGNYAMVLRDTVDSDRSVTLEYRLSW